MFTITETQVNEIAALNGILARLIAMGDNTALEPISDATFADWFLTGPYALFCLTARGEGGEIAAFQQLSTFGDLPEGGVAIGTFADPRAQHRGAGRALLNESVTRLRARGFRSITATVRADNVSGLGFYRKMGFTPYKTLVQQPLHDGRRVDRIVHQMDL